MVSIPILRSGLDQGNPGLLGHIWILRLSHLSKIPIIAQIQMSQIQESLFLGHTV